MTGTPELVQFGALTPEHFARHPVWIACHLADSDEPWYDDTDEETFRPWTGALPVDPSGGMFLVRAEFTLADGMQLPGFLTPPFQTGSVERELGVIQPQVFLPGGGRVGFWEGMFPQSADARAAIYRELDRTPEQVFPLRFRAGAGLTKGEIAGSLRGFYSVPDGRTVAVAR